MSKFVEHLLSIIMQQKVKILYVLPNESSRIAAENSLLILDIVVQLEDGSIANVECQRIGYAFPEQRCACYSADLLLRQYKRVRGDKGSEFSYKDIKKVYTIVFFEKSPKQFKSFKKQCTYIHRSRQQFDTGVKMDLLQEYIFINLDIFRYKLDNNNVDIENELEAWLTFLSVDEPDIIIKLLEKYPKFRPLYEEVYYLCLNMEKVMRMFSKELLELDKNTVQYMIDEMQEEINAQKLILDEQVQMIKEQEQELEEREQKLEEQGQKLEEQKQENEIQKREIERLNALLKSLGY